MKAVTLMSSRAVIALVVGGLVVGLFAGLALADDGGEVAKVPGAGPTKFVKGVPVGYERSKVGATNAALGYEAALAMLSRSTPSVRREALNVMAVPAGREEVVKAGEFAYDFLDKQFGAEGAVRSAVVGYRVKAYDRDAAEVELWEVSVVGRPDTVPARSGWSTRTIRLRWVNGDWRIAELPSQTDGPTPQLQEAASDSALVIKAARELEGVRYVPAP
jgi:hypothetical protein